MADVEAALKRHLPVVKYDSQESYFADSAAEWTDNPGNCLRTDDGKVLAVASPPSHQPALSLEFLRSNGNYEDGTAVQATDVVSDPSRDYREQSQRLHLDDRYRNRVYGHLAVDGEGRRWLQYWLFYYYNDYNLIGQIVHGGLHEGDWEMAQLRLGNEDAPDLAVYAQHKHAEARRWDQVDIVPGTERPIIYAARGSHASYFEPGGHWTGVWFDWANGKRRSPELTLEVVSDGDPAYTWLHWPGFWGDTKPTGNPIDSSSPRGPGVHPQWTDPAVLHGRADAALTAAKPPPPLPPPPPLVTVSWAGDRVRLGYSALPTQDGSDPTSLVVTVNSPDESAAPTTFLLRVATPSGVVDVPADLEPAHRYDVNVSVATDDGLASDSVRHDLLPRGRG